MYGWGYSGYSNPYRRLSGAAAASPIVAPQQAGVAAQQSAATAYNYSQPISTTAAPPEQAVAGQANTAFDQAREAFKAGDYAKALQLDQQALTQMPNDRTLHEFLSLVFFAQGKYDQAAEPLYAVLSVGPGWDWTTLSGMYPDVETYTRQLRALEANVRANPESAHARLRAGLPVPGRGTCRERGRAAQGGREAPAWRHPLGAAHRLLPARRRHFTSFRRTGATTLRLSHREASWELDGHARQGREDRAGDQGRRPIQLGCKRSG